MNISKWGNKISDFLGKNKQEQTGVDKTLEEVNKTPEEMAKTPDLLLDKAFIKSPDSKDKVLDTKLDSLRLSTIFDDINQWLGIKETITPTDIESVSGLSWEKLNNLLTQYSVDIKTQGKEFIEAIKNVLDIAKRNEALVS